MAVLHRFTPLHRFTVIALSFCVLFLVGAPSALAHDALKASSPAKNAKLKSVERIELEFTSRVRFPFVVLHGEGGATVKTGKPDVQGKIVTSDVTAQLPAGRYVIGWRVVSSDGHPIQGEIPFTVTGSPSTPTPSATESPEASQSPQAATSSPTGAPAVTSLDPSAAAAVPEEQAGLPGWIWLVVAGLVVLGGGVWFVSSRRGGSTDETP